MSLTRHTHVGWITTLALAFTALVMTLGVSAQHTSTTATATGIETPVVVTPNDMSWQ